MLLPRICHGFSLGEQVASSYWAVFPLRLASVNSESAGSSGRVVKVIPSKLLSSVLIVLGSVTLLFSIVISSSILALIGLGLLFFGIIFTYFSSEEHVKKVLFDATVSSQYATVKSIIERVQFQGDAVYLPPKYLSNPEAPEVFISKHGRWSLPRFERSLSGSQDFSVSRVDGLRFTPPGAELTKLFEKTLGTNFISVDLQYLQQNLPKLFVEELELAQNLEIKIEDDKIKVDIQGSVCSIPDVAIADPLGLKSTVGSPVSSAIACALSKATNKPLVIEKEQVSKDGKDVTIEFRTIEEEA